MEERFFSPLARLLGEGMMGVVKAVLLLVLAYFIASAVRSMLKALLNKLDQLNEHFRVGAALEMVSFPCQVFFDIAVVLNDSIVNQGKPAALREMGVCIDGGRLTVGCPTGVGNACTAACVMASCPFFQIGNLAFLFIYT